eukprot:9498645-Pyramimonas_sp.AAC.1
MDVVTVHTSIFVALYTTALVTQRLCYSVVSQRRSTNGACHTSRLNSSGGALSVYEGQELRRASVHHPGSSEMPDQPNWRGLRSSPRKLSPLVV